MPSLRKKSTRKPFFLIDEVERVDDELLQSLLGLAVRDPSRPISGDHAPPPPYSIKARNATDYLYPPEPTYCRDVVLAQKTTKSKRARMQFEKLVRGSVQSGDSDAAVLKAAGLRRISMRNAPDTIRKLLSKPPPKPADDSTSSAAEPTSAGFLGGLLQGATRLITGDPAQARQRHMDDQAAAREQYRTAVLTLLDRHGSLGIITSFITCTDMTKEVNTEKRRAADLDVGTGSRHTTGTPIEMMLGAGTEATRDVGTRGTYEGEYLIACSYLPLELRNKSRGISLGPIDVRIRRNNAAVDDVEYDLGDEEVWRLGDDPIESNFEAPMGGDGNESDNQERDDDERDDNDLAFVLLHPDDKLGENTDVNEVDESDEGSSEDEQGDSRGE